VTPSERTRSDIYQAVLPMIMSGQVELLDLPRLLKQFGGLERRTARGGKDSIDHAPGQHDDVANAAAGALVLAGSAASRPAAYMVNAFSGKVIEPWWSDPATFST
jgi:hypothetical protein